jgi:hypothetical protein
MGGIIRKNIVHIAKTAGETKSSALHNKTQQRAADQSAFLA